MNSRISLFLLPLLVIGFSACKSRKHAVAHRGNEFIVDTLVKKNELVQLLRENQTQFDFFSAKIKTDFEQEQGKDVSFTMHLKMEKGKYIWISATAVLGIEAARIYITPDSVKILDKLNKRYLAKSYTYFNKFSDVPLTLESLQNLFVGNQILALSDSSATDSVETGYLLQNMILKTLYQVYVDKSDKEIFLQEFIQKDSLQTKRLSVQYSEFHHLNNVRYAHKIEIQTEAKEKLSATFEYQNVSLNPIEQIVFSIPASYTPME